MSTGRRLGKYELQERLGRGGMAEVWKAWDTQLQRFVAIKLLHADLQIDPDFIKRFEREARVVASLYHPNIVQIHDFQVSTPTESEGTIAYMVMDYVEGPTLADYIRSTSGRGNFPSAAEIVYLFASIGSAIDYAHQHGMIHRDIKPANILLDKPLAETPGSQNPIGEPILTDFGIAKLMGASTGSMSGTWLGTPLYVAPEQVQGYPGNERSDIYSLGVILYEICTGVLPFSGKDPAAIMTRHLGELPPAPNLVNPNIPPALSMVIMRCLAKDPIARFPSASSLAAALAEALNVPVPEKLNPPSYPKDTFSEPTHYQPLSTHSLAGKTASPASMPVLSPATTPTFAYTTPNLAMPAPANLPTAALPATPPTPPPPAARKRRKGLLAALIALAILVLAGGGLGTFLLGFYHRAPIISGPAGGYAFFVSSGQWNESNNQGIEDQLEMRLQNIPDPAPGKSYYVWLLSDKSQLATTSNGIQCTQVPASTHFLFLGPLSVEQGSAVFNYAGTQNTNLLAQYSRLLITEENAQPAPASPSSDQNARRYSAELPQTADKIGKCFSALDYLRHLLSEGLQIQKNGIHGGLDVRLFRNMQKILEWANSATEAWRIQPDLIHRQVIRILDYIDGAQLVQQDVPANTPLLVDPMLAQVGLATLTENQTPSSYLARMDTQLKNLSQAPGVATTMSRQAIQADRALPNVQEWLKQARMDAKLLVTMNANQLSQTSALSLLDDMETSANYAFVGRLDPSTNAVQAGSIEIHYDVQQLAAYNIQPYKTS